MKIPITDILVVWEDNKSRQSFNADKWRESCRGLADTVEDIGLIQPVGVVKIDHPDFKYKLIFGYRRMFAIRELLGILEVEVIVLEVEADSDVAKIANLVENWAHEDPTYWESCVGLKDTFPPELTHRQVAKAMGKSHGWAYHRWGLWKMPREVIEQAQAGLLTASDINLLLSKSESEQVAAAKAIREAKERGATNREIGQNLMGRKTLLPKKEIQRVMTEYLEQDEMKYVHLLRWAIGEINDTQRRELV